jgi:hypothetical protein
LIIYVELAGAVIADFVEVVVQELLGAGVQRDIAGLVAFAVDAQMRHAAAGVDVFDLEAAELFAPQAVI